MIPGYTKSYICYNNYNERGYIAGFNVDVLCVCGISFRFISVSL